MGRLVLFIGLLAVSFSRAHSHLSILDEGDAPIGDIAKKVCSPSFGVDEQISKVSTVRALSEYMGTLPSGHKLSKCAKKHVDAINELSILVNENNDNVCSNEKITAIEKFHHDYISFQSTKAIPCIIKAFFFHYVHAISDICGQETSIFLSSISNSLDINPVEIDQSFREISEKMEFPSAKFEYKDVTLFRNLVELTSNLCQGMVGRRIFAEAKRAMTTVRNAELLFKMKDVCRKQIRPLYSYSLLSTVRLIDMGFYPTNDLALGQIRGNKRAREFYGLTNVCEVLLQGRFMKHLISFDSWATFLGSEDAARLGRPDATTGLDAPGPECKRCSIANVDQLSSVNRDQASALVQRVRNNIADRERAISQQLVVIKDEVNCRRA